MTLEVIWTTFYDTFKVLPVQTKCFLEFHRRNKIIQVWNKMRVSK